MATGTTIGKAYVQIMPSTKGIQRNLTNQLNGEVSGAGLSAGKSAGKAMVKGFITAAAAAKLGQWIGETIGLGGALEQSLGGIETLYKDSADKMKQYAAESYKTTQLSANEYMETVTSYSAGLIASLGGDTEKAADVANMAMIDMADNVNKMGTSMESIQNAYQGFAKQNYTMLDNLKLGYGGTKTEMERLLRDAEKISGVHYDISNLADVYEAIHVIQGELGITGTSAEEAENTIIGSINMMKAAWEDFRANLALGNDLTPYISNLIDSAVAMAKNIVPAIGNLLMGLVNSIPDFLSNIGDKLTEYGPTIGMKIGEWLSLLVQKLIASIPKLAVALGKIFIGLFTAVAGFAFQFFTNLIPKIQEGLQRIWTFIKEKVTTFWQTHVTDPISMKFEEMKQGLIDKFNAIVTSIKDIFNRIKNAIIAPIQKARDTIKGIIEKIKGFFNFTFSIPKIKLPHFGITPKGWKIGDLLKGKIPKLSIDWYATGGVFTQPNVIGVGEAGPEAVVPLNTFWQKLDMMADSIVNGVATVASGVAGAGGQMQIDVYLYPNGPKMMEQIVDVYDTGKRRIG